MKALLSRYIYLNFAVLFLPKNIFLKKQVLAAILPSGISSKILTINGLAMKTYFLNKPQS